MIEINVKADIRRASLFLREVEKTSARRAVSRALNRTATTVRAEAARELQKRRNLKIGVIKGAMFLKRATVKNLTAEVGVSGKPISIRNFATAGSRSGKAKNITVRIERGGKLQRLRRHGNKAFINPKWRPGVFVRKGKSRAPIQAWPPVPGLPAVFVQREVLEAIKRVVNRVFPARVEHELKYEIGKAQRKHAGAAKP